MSTALAETIPPKILPYDEFGTLTIKQKSFADNWLQHRNGRLAARLAGYDGNDNTLDSVATENLRKPAIAAYIRAKLQERHVSPDQILAELGDIAMYSLDSIAVEGSPVKTPDKIRALELAGKYHKLFADRVEVEQADPKAVADELAAMITAACQRMRESGPSGPSLDQQPAIDTTAITTE